MNNFIGYEYRDITVNCNMKSMYADAYQNFGWILDDTSAPQAGLSSVIMKFKRDKKTQNKAELTRLQRQFDACASEIISMEKSKTIRASITAYTVGLIGTAFMTGATFAYLSGLSILWVALAIFGFAGWILPYFLFHSIYAKAADKITPLIDNKYDEICEVCQRANNLLGTDK